MLMFITFLIILPFRRKHVVYVNMSAKFCNVIAPVGSSCQKTRLGFSRRDGFGALRALGRPYCW